MAVPTIDFYTDKWLQIPRDAVYGELVLTAYPPVSASCGVVVFSRPAGGGEWSVTEEGDIDNIAQTKTGPGYRCILDADREYVIRFQGQAHLLMPGYADIALEFSVNDDDGNLITDFGGQKTAANTRSAGINGQVFLKRADA
jgi:hypothetical protein